MHYMQRYGQQFAAYFWATLYLQFTLISLYSSWLHYKRNVRVTKTTLSFIPKICYCLSILSIMTPVYPASIGDQAIARVDRQWVGRSEKRAQERHTAKRRYSSSTGVDAVESQCGSCPCILAKWPMMKNYREVDAGCDR